MKHRYPNLYTGINCWYKNLVKAAFTVTFTSLLMSNANAQQDTITIGTGTSATTGTGESPFGTYFHDNKNQILFTAAELNAAGYVGGFLKGIAFQVSGTPAAQSMIDFEVQLKSYANSTLTTFDAGFTTVFHNTITASSGWKYIMFNTPYYWNGTSNLLIQTCFNNASYTSNTSVFYTSTASSMHVYGYSDSSVPDPCGTEPQDGTTTQRPNTKFIFEVPTPNDAGIVSIDNPGIPACNFGNDVWATIQNFGTNTLSTASINWSINGVAQTPLAWTGSLTIGQSISVLVGSGTISATDQLKVWTTLPNGVPEAASGATNDTISRKIYPGYSGIYLINSVGGGDFSSFQAAVDSLVKHGVCGPVTCVVNDGIYNERVIIPNIIGASSTNRVTFTSLNSVSDVVLIHTPAGATDNWTLTLDGANYVTFHDMTIATGGTSTYSGVIEISGGASNNAIDSCIIAGAANPGVTTEPASCIHSNGSIDSLNVISNNSIIGGSYGMYLRGSGTGTGAKLAYKIIGNNVSDYYYMGLYMYYHRDLEEAYNESAPGNAYTGSVYRFYNYYCDGKLRFHHNKSSRTKAGYGAYIAYCSGTSLEPGYVYNNSISVGDPATTGLAYGLSIYYCNYQVVTNNSVNVESNSTTSRALYHYYGSNNRILNNIFANNGPSYAIYTYGTPTLFSDNNNYYFPNGIMAYDNGSNVSTLANWQSNYGYDLHSYNVDPQFTTFEDLTTCVDDFDKSASTDPLITDDYTGHLRGSMPDIGAFEFDGIAKFSIGADTTICPLDYITIGDSTSTSSWIWNTTATTNTISFNGPGTIIGQMSNSCGVATDTINIYHHPSPNADFDFTTSYLTGIFSDQSAGADSWFWDFGDGNTSTLQDPLHVYTTTGLYNVTLTINGLCGTSTYTGTVQIWINGVDDLEAIDFNMYPNPASDNVMLTSGTALKNATVEVMDAAGRIVVSSNASGNVINLNVADLETGSYFVRITDEGRASTKQLIVQ